jgi:threonine dehydratase
MTTISPTGTALVTLDDLEAAARALAPVAVRTPLLPFDALSEQLVAEPSGAITIAALTEGSVRPSGGTPTVVVLSGGNIEWNGLRELLLRGT